MIKNIIKKLSQYNPPLEGRGESDYLLLDFNERTTPASPKVKEALRKFVESDRFQAYPEYGSLEAKIADYAGVGSGGAMATNGGDQGIDAICRAFLGQGDKVVIPFPEFAMHYQSALIQGAEIIEPKYKEEGRLPMEEILGLMEDEKVKLVIFSNPNNPTGIFTEISDVEKILKKAKEKDIAVLHDEAYFEFSKATAKDLIDEYNNLYIIRTFAKAFGLVAARAGYVLSQKENIQELMKIRGPYDVNMFAKTAVLAALDDLEYMENYVKEVMERSKPAVEEFLKEKGLFFYPSRANYLLVKIPDAQGTIDRLKEKGILTRPKLSPTGEISLRVSIGTVEDTERFITAFKALV